MRGMRKAVQPITVQEGQGLQVSRVLSSVLKNSFFEYAVTVNFVGNETQTATIQIQSDAHFIVVMTVYDTNMPAAGGFGAGVGAQFGGSLVQLTDISGQRFLSSQAVPVSTLFGTGREPFVWPFTHLFRASGGIQLQVTGIVAAAVQQVRYIFAGYKIPVGLSPGL